MRPSNASVRATGLTSPCRILEARPPMLSNASVSAMPVRSSSGFRGCLASLARGHCTPRGRSPGDRLRSPGAEVGSAAYSPDMSARDVIVIGGGGVGATAAYLCARAGLTRPLIDPLDDRRAADARGAGFISPRTSARHEALFGLGLRSAAYYDTLLDQLAEDGGGETGHARGGDLRVAITDDEIAPFRALVALVDERRARFGR